MWMRPQPPALDPNEQFARMIDELAASGPKAPPVPTAAEPMSATSLYADTEKPPPVDLSIATEPRQAQRDVPTGKLTGGEKTAMGIDAIVSGLSSGLGQLGRRTRPGAGFDVDFWQAQKDRRAQQAKQYAADEDADPASEQSRRAQAAMTPMLTKLGLSSDEIASLSATQLSELAKGGNLAMQLAKARAAAQVAAAERAQKIEDLKEKRTYEETQAAGPEFERRLRIAEIQSGMGADRAKQQAYLADQLARDRERERWLREQDTKGGEKAKEGAKDFGLALQKTGIPNIEASLDRVAELEAKLRKKNGGKLFSQADDAKRRVGDAFSPEVYNTMSDPDAREFMRQVQGLRNAEIKDISGGAVADSEFGRNKAAMGISALADPDAITRWTEGMRTGLQADRENLLGAFGPEAAEQYERNRRGARKGGTPRQAAAAAPPTAGVVRVRNPKTGEVKPVKDSPELRKRIDAGLLEVVGG